MNQNSSRHISRAKGCIKSKKILITLEILLQMQIKLHEKTCNLIGNKIWSEFKRDSSQSASKIHSLKTYENQ